MRNANENCILKIDCFLYVLDETEEKKEWTNIGDNKKTSPIFILYNSERNVYRIFAPTTKNLRIANERLNRLYNYTISKTKTEESFPGLPLHFVDEINKKEVKESKDSLSSIILTRNSSINSNEVKDNFTPSRKSRSTSFTVNEPNNGNNGMSNPSNSKENILSRNSKGNSFSNDLPKDKKSQKQFQRNSLTLNKNFQTGNSPNTKHSLRREDSVDDFHEEKENEMSLLISLIHKDIVFSFKESDLFFIWRDSLSIYGLKFQKKQHFNLFKNCFSKVVGELKNPGIFYQLNDNGKKIIFGCSLSQLTNLLITVPSNLLFDTNYKKILLFTHQYYTSSQNFLKILIEMFHDKNIINNLEGTNKEKNKIMENTKTNIIIMLT
eukprot:TRINITY_DN2386_c0_g2_i1.p1 TRINITY_DN2386_c0_g2~~TRINITY_DN2386_c0_g2_i1.p1  ORF type:complete len:380 (+),score=87.91 TRINITY_DN2386_c0_g2_i1:88-1227(+)